MRVELPWPSYRLSPNARNHHFVGARLKRTAKLAGYYIAISHGVSRIVPGELPVTVLFQPKSGWRGDEDNAIASMKSYLDGIALAVGVDDRLWRIDWQWDRAPRKTGSVVVTLHPRMVMLTLRGSVT